MKIDPYKHKEKYLRWKESVNGKIPDISSKNSEFVWNYVLDMEHGINVASGTKKGSRSYIHLNNLRQRMIFLVKLFEEKTNLLDISKVALTNAHRFVFKDSEKYSNFIRNWVFSGGEEIALLIEEIKILNPNIIIFQSLNFKSEKYSLLINYLKKNKIKYYIGLHPSFRVYKEGHRYMEKTPKNFIRILLKNKI